MSSPCHVEHQSFPRAGGQLMEISTPVVHPTPTWDLAHEYNQPKDTEPGSGSDSRSIYDILSQELACWCFALRKPALVSAATGLCILKKRKQRARQAHPSPATAAWLVHCYPIFVHLFFWFGVKIFVGNKANLLTLDKQHAFCIKLYLLVHLYGNGRTS